MTDEYENTQQLAYPGVYAKESDIIPYSPRRQFRFMDSQEDTQQLAYPGVYAKDSDIIPYSPRKQFRFMDPNDMTNGKTITLESMRNMPIEQIVELYKNGYSIEGMSQASPTAKIEKASNDITVSSSAILLIGVGVLAYIILKK